MADVLKIAAETGMDVRLSGSGWAVRQNPEPGTPLEGNTVARVWFHPGK